MSNDVPVRELRELLIARCPGLITSLVPGCRREGNVFSAPNPTRPPERAGSFKIWFNGAWKEYDADEKGDILDLLAYVDNHDPKSREGRRHAINRAKEILGLQGADRVRVAAARKSAAERQAKQIEEQMQRELRIARRVQDILRDSFPVDPADGDSIVVRYLKGRGINPALVRNRCMPLLLHPDLPHWTEGWRGPALVSPVMQRDGAKAGVHCVFLEERANDDGEIIVKKARLNSPKLMLGVVKNGVVPLTFGASGLSLGEAAARGLSDIVILCEGRETGEALACAAPEARVWCCLSLSNMANAPINHPAVKGVALALENDIKPQALRMREKAIEQLEAHGKKLILMKPHAGNDFADLMEKEKT
jgi:hypothetical protein